MAHQLRTALQLQDETVYFLHKTHSLLAHLIFPCETRLVVIGWVALAIHVDLIIGSLEIAEVVLLLPILPLQRTLQIDPQFASLLGENPLHLGQLPRLLQYFDGDGQVEEDVLLDVVNASKQFVVDQQTDELPDDHVPRLEVFPCPDEFVTLNH